MSRLILADAVAILMCWPSANGQGSDPRPTFEVVSIKPAPPFDIRRDYRTRGGPGSGDPGQVTYPMTNAFALLVTAYGVKPDQIIGPSSLTEGNYTVAAKIPPNTSKEQFHLMLRNLLADRFHLVLHHETRFFPAYALVVAKSGLKAAPSPPGADAPQAQDGEKFGGEMQFGKDGFPVLPRGRSAITAYDEGIARGTFRITMAEFAALLPGYVSMSNNEAAYGPNGATPRISDRTGLKGKYDFKLEFAGSYRSTHAQLIDEDEDAPPGAQSPSDAPNIFTALEKQLGLRLEKGAKIELDVLVIDHVDKAPTAN